MGIGIEEHLRYVQISYDYLSQNKPLGDLLEQMLKPLYISNSGYSIQSCIS